jgi:hypothetical protein
VFSLPFVIEALAGWRRRRAICAWSDTRNSIGLGMMSHVIGVFTQLFRLGRHALVCAHAALLPLWGWLLYLPLPLPLARAAVSVLAMLRLVGRIPERGESAPAA